MHAAVFTYGSLMFAPVWERVVRGRYRSAAALADGFQRYVVRGETYPGMVHRPGQAVRGVAYFDVGDADMELLDWFEGEDYRREEIDILLDGGGWTVAAAYVYLPAERLLPDVWLPERFGMEKFLRRYCGDGRE